MDLRPFRVVLWTAACLLAAELALEVRAVGRGWEGFLLGREPGWDTHRDPRYGPDEGFPFRSLKVEPQRIPGSRRLWFASSSYAEDILLHPGQVFPNRVGDFLREAGLSVQVLNASRAGFHVGSNAAQLAERASTWQPDRVLLYQMSNDIDRISEMVAAAATRGEGQGKPGAAAPAEPARPSRVASWAERMTAYHHLKTNITTRVVKGRPLLQGLGAEGDALYERAVRDFIELVRSIGAEPILCTFATSHRRGEIERMPAKYERQILAINVELDMLGWVTSVERFNAVLRRIADEQGLLLVDVAAALEGHSELFRDFWHFLPEGHDRVARTIAEALLQSKR